MFYLKSKSKNKDDRIVIRLSKDEKEFLQKYCKEKNITVSEYVYNLLCIDLTMFKR